MDGETSKRKKDIQRTRMKKLGSSLQSASLRITAMATMGITTNTRMSLTKPLKVMKKKLKRVKRITPKRKAKLLSIKMSMIVDHKEATEEVEEAMNREEVTNREEIINREVGTEEEIEGTTIRIELVRLRVTSSTIRELTLSPKR